MSEDRAEVKLTRAGMNEFKEIIWDRDQKHGSDDYLIEFMEDDLAGRLAFEPDLGEEDEEMYLIIEKLEYPS